MFFKFFIVYFVYFYKIPYFPQFWNREVFLNYKQTTWTSLRGGLAPPAPEIVSETNSRMPYLLFWNSILALRNAQELIREFSFSRSVSTGNHRNSPRLVPLHPWHDPQPPRSPRSTCPTSGFSGFSMKSTAVWLLVEALPGAGRGSNKF